MPVLLTGALWAVLVGYLLFRTLQQLRAHRLMSLPAAPRAAGGASVSIIVPVRNEIANIGSCLAGLAAQSCLGGASSATIVDDNSDDGTAAVAREAIAEGAPVRLSFAGPLPPGWMGKPHACWKGATLAQAEWLCFIDCDVRIAPSLVASALAAAEAEGLDMLSLQPFQELGSFWERLIFPAGLLIIGCARERPSVTGWASKEEMANGQFILIRRDAYFEIGGHQAVRGEICEDKALAARVRNAGLRFRVLRAEHLARTRMYRDFRGLWEGFSKNAIEVLGGIPMTLFAAVGAVLVGWAALLFPPVLLAEFVRNPSTNAGIGLLLGISGSAVVIGIQLATARHFRIPTALGLLFAIGYTLAAALACRSVFLHLKGRVTWKGRTYELGRKLPLGG